MFAAVPLLLTAGVSAYAGSVSIDFTFNTLSAGATDAQIQTYMNALIHADCATCSVTVTGAVADQTYNGDGHVTGPGNGSTSLTLGDSTGATASNTNSTVGATDTFIANTNDSSGQISTEITMTFTGFSPTVTSFDYEIFPDGTCSELNSADCGGAKSGGYYPNQPDLDFNVNGSTVSTFYGVTPGTTNGTAVHSPNSGSFFDELAPQLIGTWSGTETVNAGTGSTDGLAFVDWPATIGIDNLTLSFTPDPVPEPGSIALLVTSVVGCYFVRRKRQKAL
jgi:hypothetical protein